MARLVLVLVLLALGVAGLVPAAERSQPVDCLPDRVSAFDPLAASPDALFGAAYVPGIVLGPPGDSLAIEGVVTVATLGFGGSVVLSFDDLVIEDRPGPDFIVFENGFFKLPLPVSADDTFRVFGEPALVEVSPDGVVWESFPFDPAALQAVAELPATGDIERSLYLQLEGLAGVTPTFSGNWTVPNDPELFDPLGTGGVSGAGGDAFDLAQVGLAEARFVRITDADTQIGFPGSGAGFDLDALVVLHGRPDAPRTLDTDGDRLSDREELALYGSNPILADTDGDGVDDGREVAGCRDPATSGVEPYLLRQPRLWAFGTQPTEWRWTFLGSELAYELVRGDLAFLTRAAATIDLGAVVCLPLDGLQPSVRWRCGPEVSWPCELEQPLPDQGFFYLVRLEAAVDYGRSSELESRVDAGACP
jgi:hypothetical protein